MLNRLLIGVIGRALSLFDLELCFVVFLSNHAHFLVVPRDGEALSGFMQHVNSNVAREAGRLHRWKEKFWSRRARVIWTSDEPEAQVARLVYLLEQGVKEGPHTHPCRCPPTPTHAGATRVETTPVRR